MTHKITRLRRMQCLLLAVLLMLGLCLYSAPPAYADRKAELQAELNAAQKDLENVQQQIKDNQANKENAEALKQQLQQEKNIIINQIATVREKIIYVEDQISQKEAEIAQKEEEITQKQQEYDTRWEGFKQRMRAMQRLNDSGTLAILSNATSLYQLLTFSTMMEKIAEKDTEICDELENQRIELENARTELENSKAELEGDRDQLSAMEGQLTANIQTQNANISAAEANAQALDEAEEAARKKAEDAKKALDAYLNAQVNKYSSAAITCSLNFGPPLASYSRISDVFGRNGHRGTDFAAAGGTAIYAVGDGVVTDATWHWSWGNYVQIYHGKDDEGNTYSTLYAHMIQAPSVSAGQNVTRGQVIGYVGNTGYSFGNHLHLEMKINGVLVNSANYVPH